MTENRHIGVFICRCGGNISDVIDVDKLREFASELNGVKSSMWNMFTCSAEGQGRIQEKIKEDKLDGVVIGCCTPRQYEEMFRETLAGASLNPFVLEIANLREQCSYPHHEEPDKALEKAKLLIKAAVEKVRLLTPLEVGKATVSTEIAIAGGGIAGIHSASTLAQLGYNVHLIEREPTVGGNMARVVKTFPTDDCAMCTLSPKMDEMAKNKKINLLTYTEVENVEKVPEGLKLTVKRKPRYLDEVTCTGCGKCAEECPVYIYNPYNLGLVSTKKAVFKPFPSAVPNKYFIEKRGIPPCREACPVHQNAQGYAALIAAGKIKEAYQIIRRDNPLPSVCGRVCNHVCEDKCSRRDEGGAISIAKLKRFVMEHPSNTNDETPPIPEKKAGRIAVIGGGPAGLACAHDLALGGFSVTVFEAEDKVGGALALTIPRYRLPDDILNRDIEYIKKLGVTIETKTKIEDVKKLTEEYDAVFMAVGLRKDKMLKLPGSDLPGVMLGGEFLRSVKRGDAKFDLGKRVLVIGGGNVAFDVGRSALRLGAEDVHLVCLESEEEMPALPDEIKEGIEEGIKIHNRMSPGKFIGRNGRLSGVEFVKVEKIEFDKLGRIRPVIIEGTKTFISADTTMFAIGQSPDIDAIRKTVDIRLTEGGTIEVDPETLKTNIPGLYAGGDAVSGPSTVVQVMAMGKKAARSIAANLGSHIEDTDVFKGLKEVPKEIAIELAKKAGHRWKERTESHHEPPAKRVRDFLPFDAGFSEDEAALEAKRCLQCGGCCDCGICASVCEAKAIHYDQTPQYIALTVGGVIVATGFKEYDPSKLMYGYGHFDNVITQFQLARMMDPLGPTKGTIVRISDGKPAKRIVMIQCVGSRGDKQGSKLMHSYCSRVCCMVALKHAGLIKKNFIPDAEIYICYIDIRAFGKGHEEYYERIKTQGVKFIKGLPSKAVENSGKDVTVTVEDAATEAILKIDADLLVLSSATEPSDGVTELMKLLNISKDEYGFIREFHPKIAPTNTMIKNIMVAGVAQGPKDITDAIAQAGSASSSIAAYIGDGCITLSPMIAYVDREKCRACGRCEENCEFKAVKVGDNLRAVVEAVMCEGCGKCSVICPTGAITVYGSNDRQIEAVIEGLRSQPQ